MANIILRIIDFLYLFVGIVGTSTVLRYYGVTDEFLNTTLSTLPFIFKNWLEGTIQNFDGICLHN